MDAWSATRVSAQTTQGLTFRIDSLTGLGINPNDIFTENISGAKTDRPELNACLAHLQRGDTLVVWRLDRLGRSMHHSVELIEELRNRRVGFRSVSDGLIDTTSPSGEFIFHIFSALAQFERRLIQERTRSGLASARARVGWAVARQLTSIKRKCVLQESCMMITRLTSTTSAKRLTSLDQRITVMYRCGKRLNLRSFNFIFCRRSEILKN
jgi:DNA invertase Pin-like site-specific DNA recombinase